MQALRQMGSGFIIGAVSLLLVVGGISLALTETTAPSSPATPTPLPPTFAVEFASPEPGIVPSAIPTALATLAFAQPTISCPAPAGWQRVVVSANDTLYSIALRYNTTVEELNDKNCLNFVNPPPGSSIYVPAVPTQVVAQCSPPAGWVKNHVVKPGENLFRIALSYGLTYPQLQAGNCMGSSTTIFVGQVLWVPNIPTRTPTPTRTSTVDYSTPTATASKTPDFSTPTSTFVVTASPTLTNTPITSTSQ